MWRWSSRPSEVSGTQIHAGRLTRGDQPQKPSCRSILTFAILYAFECVAFFGMQEVGFQEFLTCAMVKAGASQEVGAFCNPAVQLPQQWQHH